MRTAAREYIKVLVGITQIGMKNTESMYNNTYNHEALRVSVLRVFLSSTLSIRLLRPMRMNSVLKEPNPDTGRINIRA
jgi:hypothetical protein